VFLPSKGVSYITKRRLAITAAFAAIAIALTGCSKADEAAEGFVGVILPDAASSNRWETADRGFLQAAFDAAGVKVDIQNANAGMIFASRQNSVSPTTGGSSTLLYAVGAAVIGGTSLFGGKGKMRDAILGGLVVAVIDNGMGLLGYAAGIKFIVTGLVLLVSAGVDAISRKGASV
jgi:hypothetical protein